jgi:predicted heme/steroid binding protein/uncharacterized membrane protein
MGEEREFTQEELARHDGVSEPTVYVAYRGVVYDVTASPMWKTGTHMQRHAAGRDLTPELGAAPHSEEVFSRVPRVGRLAEECDASLDHLPDALRALLEKYPVMRRPVHPVVVHLPMASALLVPFFDLAYLATGRRGLEEAALYLDLVALATAPAAVASGAFSWWVNYRARRMAGITVKIAAGGVYVAAAATLAACRLSNPGIMDDREKRLRYLALSMVLPACALVLGYFGGKIAHPH